MKFLSVIIIIILFSCAGSGNIITEKKELFPLMGMIYSTEGIPADGATVIMDGIPKAETDINGRFVIWKVPLGKHDFTIKKENFEILKTEVNFYNPSQILYSAIIPLGVLINELENALKFRKLDNAEKIIERGFKISKADPELRYLNITYLTIRREYMEALKETKKLEKDCTDIMPLILTEAEILAFGMEKADQALELLKKYSNLYNSEELEKLAGKIYEEVKDEKIQAVQTNP